MPVIREGICYLQSSHDHERDVINDAGLAGFAAAEVGPRRIDLLRCWFNQKIRRDHCITKLADVLPIRMSRGRVSTFEEDHGCGDELPSGVNEIGVNGGRAGHPIGHSCGRSRPVRFAVSRRDAEALATCTDLRAGAHGREFDRRRPIHADHRPFHE